MIKFIIIQQNQNIFDKLTSECILYFAIFMLLCLVFLNTKNKKQLNKKQIDLFSDYDKYSNEINLMIDQYKLYYNEVYEKCIKEENRDAFEYLKKCKEEFENIFDHTYLIANDIQKSIEKNNCKKAGRDMQLLGQSIIDIESLIEQLDVAKSIVESDCESKKYREQEYEQNEILEDAYFLNCQDKESLVKSYKMLAKAFHPDAGYGDEKSFKRMQEEYERKLKEYE